VLSLIGLLDPRTPPSLASTLDLNVTVESVTYRVLGGINAMKGLVQRTSRERTHTGDRDEPDKDKITKIHADLSMKKGDKARQVS
jgi:hypothetical protein